MVTILPIGKDTEPGLQVCVALPALSIFWPIPGLYLILIVHWPLCRSQRHCCCLSKLEIDRE